MIEFIDRDAHKRYSVCGIEENLALAVNYYMPRLLLGIAEVMRAMNSR